MCNTSTITKTWVAYGNSPGMHVNTRYINSTSSGPHSVSVFWAKLETVSHPHPFLPPITHALHSHRNICMNLSRMSFPESARPYPHHRVPDQTGNTHIDVATLASSGGSNEETRLLVAHKDTHEVRVPHGVHRGHDDLIEESILGDGGSVFDVFRPWNPLTWTLGKARWKRIKQSPCFT